MTIKEIAKKAKVSIGTVDRVLHKRGRVAKETEKRILDIVKESGYNQNLFASNLANSHKTYRIAVMMPHLEQDSAYWALVKRGIDTASKELQGFNVKIELLCFDRFNGDDFRRVYKTLLSQDFDGIFIAPVISNIAKECCVNQPIEVPFAFFDSDLPEISPLFFIGQNSFQGGVLGGKLLHILVGESKNVAVTRMLPEGYHINDRVNGFKSYFKQFPSVNVHEFEIDYNGYEKNIFSSCKKMLEKIPDLSALFVTNANTHYFAEAMEKIAGGRNIKIVGFDLVEKNRDCLNSGKIDFLISQNPELQAITGLNLLSKRIILKKELEKKHILSLDIFTKENLPITQNKYGGNS